MVIGSRILHWEWRRAIFIGIRPKRRLLTEFTCTAFNRKIDLKILQYLLPLHSRNLAVIFRRSTKSKLWEDRRRYFEPCGHRGQSSKGIQSCSGQETWCLLCFEIHSLTKMAQSSFQKAILVNFDTLGKNITESTFLWDTDVRCRLFERDHTRASINCSVSSPDIWALSLHTRVTQRSLWMACPRRTIKKRLTQTLPIRASKGHWWTTRTVIIHWFRRRLNNTFAIDRLISKLQSNFPGSLF